MHHTSFDSSHNCYNSCVCKWIEPQKEMTSLCNLIVKWEGCGFIGKRESSARQQDIQHGHKRRTLDAQPWELGDVGITEITVIPTFGARHSQEKGKKTPIHKLFMHLVVYTANQSDCRSCSICHIYPPTHPSCTPSSHSVRDYVVNISCKQHIIMMHNDWLWLA